MNNDPVNSLIDIPRVIENSDVQFRIFFYKDYTLLLYLYLSRTKANNRLCSCIEDHIYKLI